ARPVRHPEAHRDRLAGPVGGLRGGQRHLESARSLIALAERRGHQRQREHAGGRLDAATAARAMTGAADHGPVPTGTRLGRRAGLTDSPSDHRPWPARASKDRPGSRVWRIRGSFLGGPDLGVTTYIKAEEPSMVDASGRGTAISDKSRCADRCAPAVGFADE